MNNVADLWMSGGIEPTACVVCGRDACEDHLPSRPTSVQSPNVGPVRLVVQRALEVIKTPRPVDIIEGVASAGGVSVLVSESGVGKTFVLFDVSAAVADGVPWHGRATSHGSVVYLGYEGDALGLRLRALRDVGGRRLEHLYVVRAHDPLSPRVTRDGEERSIGEITVTLALETLAEELAASRRPPIVLVVIDTVRASLSGSEDSSEHVAAYIRAVRRLMTRTPSAGAILAHHAGWQDGEQQRKRERGSSAWRGNCDCTLYLEAGDYDADRGEAALVLRALKVRDAERPAPLHLIRRRVELCEMDRQGQPVTSCVIEPDRRSTQDRDAERLAVANAAQQETDLTVLRAMRDVPAATSISRLRPYVGLRTDAVNASVVRILHAHLAVEGKRGHPYTLTEAGLVLLNGHDS